MVTASHDTVICKGGMATLSASGQLIFDYQWSPSYGLNQTYVANPVANPQVTTTYTVSVTTLLDSNLITNGDFENGNTGFSSSYTYNPTSVYLEATYAVTNNPQSVHPDFAPCDDHTSGLGNMMVINGAGTPNTSIWCQTIPVIPNTNYAFSTWLTTVVVSSPAVLQFSINGVILAQPFTAPSTNCTWQQFYEVWNSGSATVAEICIVNQNTSMSGNDFALDDISFKRFCLATDSVTVFIQQVNADAGSDTSVCIGDTVFLNASGGVKYHWNSGHYGSTVQIVPLTDTIYFVTVTDILGCKGEDSIRVNLLSLPTANAGPDQTICGWDTAILQASGGISYLWSNGDTGMIINVSPPVSAIYQVIVFDSNSCKNTDTVIVIVNPGPNAEAGEEKNICMGDSVTLTASGGNQYLWSNGISTAVITVTPGNTSYFYVTVTDTTDCINSDSVMVIVNPLPIVSGTSQEPVICVGTSTYLSAIGANQFHWMPFDVLSDSTGTKVLASPLETTTFTIVGTDASGCIDTAEVIIEVIDCSLTIPNVFTPNSDGKNDLLKVEYKGISDFYLIIFNRWGKPVFETSDKTNYWDGRISGTDASEGVYYLYLVVGKKNYNGSVTLLR